MRIIEVLFMLAVMNVALSRANRDESADTRSLFTHEEEDRDLKGMSDLLKAKQGLLKDIQEKSMDEKRSSAEDSDISASKAEMEEEGSEMDEEE